MKNAEKTIIAKLDDISRIAKKFTDRSAKYDKLLEVRMRKATDIVWRIAHQKRPMISKEQMKAEGRVARVSDPSAQAGVPVRTGDLQASIKQEVNRKGRDWQGTVFTKWPYAAFMEYGTSKVSARPFMRPAVNLTKDAIKRLFGLKVDTTL